MFFYVLIVCTVTLPPGVNLIAVDKYIYVPQGLNINVTVGIKREDSSGASHSFPSVASVERLCAVDGVLQV